jgi:uncharacterized protein YuzE
MKVIYDARTDTLSVILNEGVPVAESAQQKPGVILDFDQVGNLLSLEVRDASQHVTDVRIVEFRATDEGVLNSEARRAAIQSIRQQAVRRRSAIAFLASPRFAPG